MKTVKKTQLASAFLAAMTIANVLAPLSVNAKMLPGDPGDSSPEPTQPVPVTSPTDDDEGSSLKPRKNQKSYALVSADQQTNAYSGDTSINEAHSLLCIKQENLPKPAGLPAPETTPGGALKGSWSGGSIFAIPKVLGTKLTSRAVADGLCSDYGQNKYGVSGFRMAEFHDGDKAGNPGWSYWGDTSKAAQREFEGFNDRFWVGIDDQKAKPWGSLAGKAMTWVKSAEYSPKSTNTDSQTHPIEYYTQQAGLTDPAKIGEEKWIDACDVVAEQGAFTFNSGITKTCTYQVDNGWQIVESKLDVLENKYGRGSYTSNIIAKDGQFSVNEQEIGAKWKVAIEAATKAKDTEARAKLELEYQRNIQLIRNYSANKNTFFMEVTANGGLGRKSVVHVVGKVKLVRIA